MNDTELFELCKEVYERFPEWKVAGLFTMSWREKGGFVIKKSISVTQHYSDAQWSKTAPLYTSDYLLEKLPPHIKLEKTNRYYAIWLDDEDDIKGHAFGDDTSPLKALLKLVIALDDAGVKL